MRECWRFSRQEIKHIHAIHYDRFRSRLWICTGDLDHESNIYYTDDEFSSIKKFGGGDQSWRAIAMVFDEHGMEWGMDAGKDAPADAVNYIYRYDFRTGIRSSRVLVGNPVYSACEFADGAAVMQTTFEPGRPQNTIVKQRHCGYADKQGAWTNILELPYDVTKPRQGVGAYGYICLPQGISPVNRLVFTPVNCGNNSHVLYGMTTSVKVKRNNSVHRHYYNETKTESCCSSDSYRGGINALGVVRSLGAAGVPVWVLDDNSKSPAMRSRFATPKVVSVLEGQSFIEELNLLAAQISGAAVVFLTEEKTVLTVSAMRDQLARTLKLRLPAHDCLLSLMHKEGFQVLAENLGFLVPPAVRLSGNQDLRKLTGLRFPLCF